MSHMPALDNPTLIDVTALEARVDVLEAAGSTVTTDGTTITGDGSVGDPLVAVGAAPTGDAMLTGLRFSETDLGLLGAGPLDLDLSGYSTVCYKFTCALGGTKIRSIKRVNNNAEQIIILKNMSNSVLPGDYVCVLMQDDPSAVYRSIHLEGRQPWHVLPALASIALHMDTGQTKWFALHGLDFQTGKKPIPITATIADAPINSLDPPDDTTALQGRYADWWRLVPGASTVINGIAAPLPAGSTYSRRLLLTNYGASSLTLKHNSGTGDKPIFCPGATDFTIRTLGSQWLTYDGGNNLWMVDAP